MQHGYHNAVPSQIRRMVSLNSMYAANMHKPRLFIKITCTLQSEVTQTRPQLRLLNCAKSLTRSFHQRLVIEAKPISKRRTGGLIRPDPDFPSTLQRSIASALLYYFLMDYRVPPRGHANVVAVIEELFTGMITADTAAERIAALTLEGKPESGLNCTWASITLVAHDHPQKLENLTSLLISMANLPDAKTVEGGQLIVYDAKVWSDLPMLGWAFNNEWNGYTIPDEEPRRSAVIQKFTNINTLTALLMRSGKAVFDYAVFAVFTMEEALETPVEQAIRHPDAFIPAAAAWISVLGQEMYQWDTEFPHGELEGDTGAGGPLWHGQHGPSRERWQLWHRRFKEISQSNDYSEKAKHEARSAAAAMAEIEGR